MALTGTQVIDGHRDQNSASAQVMENTVERIPVLYVNDFLSRKGRVPIMGNRGSHIQHVFILPLVSGFALYSPVNQNCAPTYMQ